MNTPTLEDKPQDQSMYEYMYAKILSWAFLTDSTVHRFEDDILIIEKGDRTLSLTKSEVRLSYIEYTHEYDDPEIVKKNGIITHKHWTKECQATIIFPDYINNEEQANEILRLVFLKFKPVNEEEMVPEVLSRFKPDNEKDTVPEE